MIIDKQETISKYFTTLSYNDDWNFLIEAVKIIRKDIEMLMLNNLKKSNDYNAIHNLIDTDGDYNEDYVLKNAKYEAALYPIKKALKSLDKEEMTESLYNVIIYLK